jgi:ubiquinone/menaquinone biosynthesis C-methylase UbiE
VSGIIHPHARSYGGAADAYERGRPEYPPAAVAHVVSALRIGPGTAVLDLAAGTGKFTRQLAPIGARILALEPVAGMRAKLRERLPDVTVLDGTAEAIPLPDAAVDAVTVAQAFHWFRGAEALAEMRRVLRPGGGVALVWNVRDESADWVKRLGDLMDPYGGGAPRFQTGLWRKAFEPPNGFTPLELSRFPFSHESSAEQVVDRAGSTSFVAGLSDAARKGLLDDVRHMLREHPQTRGRERIAFPYITEVYCCRRA